MTHQQSATPQQTQLASEHAFAAAEAAGVARGGPRAVLVSSALPVSSPASSSQLPPPLATPRRKNVCAVMMNDEKPRSLLSLHYNAQNTRRCVVFEMGAAGRGRPRGGAPSKKKEDLLLAGQKGGAQHFEGALSSREEEGRAGGVEDGGCGVKAKGRSSSGRGGGGGRLLEEVCRAYKGEGGEGFTRCRERRAAPLAAPPGRVRCGRRERAARPQRRQAGSGANSRPTDGRTERSACNSKREGPTKGWARSSSTVKKLRGGSREGWSQHGATSAGGARVEETRGALLLAACLLCCSETVSAGGLREQGRWWQEIY